MLNLLWLVPALPLAGFAVLALTGGRLPRRWAGLVGVGSVALSAVLAPAIGASFVLSPPPGDAFTQVIWQWLRVAGFDVAVALRLDSLSLVMVLVVVGVGFLIHLYSAEYMADDESYSRFFAYMNLFVGMMLILVLADNLLLLYLGWEGVGLCSYLLIGFWYRDVTSERAARKAFVVTRVGDTALAIGLFLIFTNLGTLDIQPAMARAAAQWPVGSTMAVAAAALLLGGALGKSAQLPLQVWLPDAMAGPTPTSALIHAATMVTAGVYLIARTNTLFMLAPVVMTVVAAIGALTLLLAGFSAVVQRDIKRILAYSTISQIGYMFLALGVGAWSAAIFHLVTHAFFKALLFLSAGALILALHEEHDIFKMGGLRKEMPLAFWTFLAGAASLAAFPLVTAGFYSKDLILAAALTAQGGELWLWLAGLTGAFLTGLYTFRMVFVVFFGTPSQLVRDLRPLRRPGWRMAVPLVTLAVLAIVAGYLWTPSWLFNVQVLPGFLQQNLPPTQLAEGAIGEIGLAIASIAVALGGIALAWAAYVWRPSVAASLAASRAGAALHRFWLNGWGFDWLYERIFIRPYVWFAAADKDDIVDRFFAWIASLAAWLGGLLSRTQTGRVRWYAAGIALGAVLAIALTVAL